MSGIGDRLALPPVTANPVRPGTQHEVVQLLSSTIGDAVLEEMDARDGFHRSGNLSPHTEGTPPVQAPAATQTPPATQQVNPAQPPVAPQTQTPPAQAGRKILGKYDSEEEAERGYHSLVHLNKQVMARNDELLRMVAQQNTQAATGSTVQSTSTTTPANPAVSSDLDGILSTLQANYNLEVNDTKKLVEGILATAEVRARDAARREMDAREAPVRVIQQADDYLLGKYPEAAAFGDEIAQFVHGDPELQTFVEQGKNAGDLRLPMEIAWLKFNQQVLLAKERVGQIHADVSQQEVERTRVDAGLISTQASGTHENASASNALTKQDMDRLIGMFHAGYKEPLLRATIGATLPDELFGIQQ